MKELWRAVPGFEGRYAVSNLGRVRSLPRKYGRVAEHLQDKPKLLKAWNSSGYRHVKLYGGGGVTKDFGVHRLVLMTFVGPCPENMQACHNDGNPANNHAGNLRWDTHKANMKDRDDHGNWMRGSKACRAKLTEEQVYVIRELLKTTRSMNSIGIEYKVNVATIRDIRDRVTWKHLPELTSVCIVDSQQQTTKSDHERAGSLHARRALDLLVLRG